MHIDNGFSSDGKIGLSFHMYIDNGPVSDGKIVTTLVSAFLLSETISLLTRFLIIHLLPPTFLYVYPSAFNLFSLLTPSPSSLVDSRPILFFPSASVVSDMRNGGNEVVFTGVTGSIW